VTKTSLPLSAGTIRELTVPSGPVSVADRDNEPVLGDKNAKVTIVEFGDFQCPYCSKVHETLFPQLLKEYGDRIAFIYKDFPLSEIHAWASHAAVNANCLAAQNPDAYWDFADYVHGNQKEINGAKGVENQYADLDKLATLQGQKHNLDATKLQACVKAQDDKAVRASQSEADKIGVSATPALFVNGQKVDGAVPIEDLRVVLDRALLDAGVTPPKHKPAPAETKSVPEKPSK